MKAIKITALGAILLCLTLVILAVVTKNPEVRLYDKTVEQLMISEGFSSEQEVLANVPHLAEIKGKMNELDNLKYHVQSKVQDPVPTSSRAEERALETKMGKIRQLRKEVRKDLKRISTTQGRIIP